MARRNRSHDTKSDIITVLDVGSNKTTCLIASYVTEIEAEDFQNRIADLTILGVGVQRSGGIKSGMVVDMEKAQYAISAAVTEAERMAELQVEEVTLLASCGRVKSVNFAAGIDLAEAAVREPDIDRILDAGEKAASQDKHEVLHIAPLGFRLDESAGVTDPRSMLGHHLAADIHAVVARRALISNLLLAVTSAGISVSNIVPSAYASAIATITEEEALHGVTCIDIGGGSTKFALFAEGRFIFSDSFPNGAHHITQDIAHALGTSDEEAERMKALHGTMVSSGADSQKLVSVSRVHNPAADDNCLTKSQLSMMIKPRLEDILNTVRERLDTSGFHVFAGPHVVLTGGGASLAGLGHYASSLFHKEVRIGEPMPVEGLPETMEGPAYANPIGGILYDLYPEPLFGRDFADQASAQPSGYWDQFKQWILESF